MVKMIDVARHAGVSIKTVSRVLNDEPHVNLDLRERVRESVRELGYVPSATARSLRSNKSYQIQLISHSLRSNFVNAVQFGALQVCQQRGYQMLVSLLEEVELADEARLREFTEHITKNSRPEGLILLPPMSNDQVLARHFIRLRIPVVRIGPNEIDDGSASVMIDDYAAAREVVDYLLALGHTRIGFVRGKEDQNATDQRYQGYADSLATAGVSVDQALVKRGDFHFETGLKAGDELLQSSEPPTAVFASNDDMAAGVLVSAHRHHVAVPAELSIVGFDDSEIAEKMWPALTTVRQPLHEFGGRAVNALIARGAKHGAHPYEPVSMLEYELVIRQSTGRAPSRG